MKQRRAWSKKGTVLFALFVALLGGLGWLIVPAPDLLFHGIPESVWIKSIDYNGGEEQTKRWRDFGAEGVRLLVRGLDEAHHPFERAYRNAYRRFAPRLPGFLLKFLPAPRPDSGRATRMGVVELLKRLGEDARLATPAMIRALRDEDRDVRTVAMGFFTLPEDESALLNQIDAKEKRKLLPDFIRAVEDKSDRWALRNNAAIALKYFREQRETVAPVLVKALQDAAPQVRMCAAESLNRVAPDLITKARVVPVVIGVLRDPDDQVAYRAAQLLGEMRAESTLAVPALIEALENTSTLVAATAAQALVKFKESADTIIPALEKVAQHKDNVSGYAKGALKQIESATPANAGAQK